MNIPLEIEVLDHLKQENRGGYALAVARWEETSSLDPVEQRRHVILGGIQILYRAYGPIPESWPLDNLAQDFDANDFTIPRQIGVVAIIEKPVRVLSSYTFTPTARLSDLVTPYEKPQYNNRQVLEFLRQSPDSHFQDRLEEQYGALYGLQDIIIDNDRRLPLVAADTMIDAINTIGDDLNGKGIASVPRYLNIFLCIPQRIQHKYRTAAVQVDSIYTSIGR
jgi:hypothetical protein